MQIAFAGRVALVTGAAQGSGQAIAKGLQAAGARVHVADLDGDGLSAFANPNGVVTYALDISDRAAAGHVVRDIVAREREQPSDYYSEHPATSIRFDESPLSECRRLLKSNSNTAGF